MKHFKAIIGLGIFGLFLVFAIQNNSIVDFKFLMFTINQTPLFVIIIVIFILGFILGRISGWFSYIFDDHKEKRHEKLKQKLKEQKNQNP